MPAFTVALAFQIAAGVTSLVSAWYIRRRRPPASESGAMTRGILETGGYYPWTCPHCGRELVWYEAPLCPQCKGDIRVPPPTPR